MKTIYTMCLFMLLSYQAYSAEVVLVEAIPVPKLAQVKQRPGSALLHHKKPWRYGNAGYTDLFPSLPTSARAPLRKAPRATRPVSVPGSVSDFLRHHETPRNERPDLSLLKRHAFSPHTAATGALPHLSKNVKERASLSQRFAFSPSRIATKGAFPGFDTPEINSVRRKVEFQRGCTPGDFLHHRHTPRNKPFVPTQRSKFNPNAVKRTDS